MVHNILKRLALLVILVVMYMVVSSPNSQASVKWDWPGDPTINVPICTDLGYQDYPTIVNDGFGGAIITWQDFRNGNYDIYVQCIDSEGIVQWQENGVPICNVDGDQSLPIIVSDGISGAIITWRDLRHGNADIYAQRVNSEGIAQWEVDGVPICTAVNDQSSPTIVSDGFGGAIIAWEDKRSGNNFDIYARRVNSQGIVQWSENGVPICTAINDQSSPTIVSDGFGGAIVAWEDKRSGNGDIYARRVDSNGNVQWQANGVPICIAVNGQEYPTIVNDGSGGAIITWEDYRKGLSDIYAQRVDLQGIVQWQENGVSICAAVNDQFSPIIIRDGFGGAIIAWEDKRSSSSDIYAQRVNSNGVVQWEADGIPIYIAVGSQGYQLVRDGIKGTPIIRYQMVSDNAGGAIITWHDECDIYAQRVNLQGIVQWQENGVPISTAPNCQDYPKITDDDANGAIITWTDYRNGNYDIYAQRVDSNGSLGDTTPPERVIDFAVFTLTSKSITLTWTAPGDDEDTGTATVYDLRYSISPITEDNWDSATRCQDEPPPQEAGSSEMFTVADLSSKTIYYFALKTADEFSNWSGLSNVVMAKTTMKEGDVSGDDTISAYDAALILQFVVGLIDHFPFEKTSDSPVQGIQGDYTIFIPHLATKKGERIRAPIVVENVSGLLAGGIVLRYDPSILKAVDVTPSSLLSGFYWQHGIKDGQVRMAFAGTRPMKQGGEIFYVEFEIIGGYEGDQTTLIIETADFVDGLTIIRNHGQIEILPQNTALLPNYPNPFNPETWIPFKLSKSADVHIRIFNNKGELVKTFALGLKNAGSYVDKSCAVYWDGRNEKGEHVSSGVYFYTLRADDFIATRRMVILK